MVHAAALLAVSLSALGPEPADERPLEAIPDAGRPFSAADLSPYFGEGLPAQAKAEFDRGRYEKARSLLDRSLAKGPRPPHTRYLRALAALRAEEHALAAAEMGRLAKDYPPMRERCLTHAGVSNEELGRFDEAAALFAQVPEQSRLYPDARLGLARALRRKKDLAGAEQALSLLGQSAAPPWGRDVAAEALIALADLSRDRKDLKAEKENLLRLWSVHPLSPFASQAERRLGGAGKIPVEAKVARGELLVEAHRNARGIEVLAPLLKKLKLPAPLACRAHFSHGKGLRKERRHTEAALALAPVVAKCREPELRARALYVLGSSQSIIAHAQAAQTYEALSREYPGNALADDALFYAADVYLKQGDEKNALAHLAELAERYPEGDFFAEALFKASWIHRAAGRAEEQLGLLGRIEKQFAAAEESYEVERARYWRARTLEGRDEKLEAAQLLEAIALGHPATYYGLLARERLSRLDPPRAASVEKALVFPRPEGGPWPIFAGPLGEDPHFLAGLELLRLGFPDAASLELLAIARGVLPPESIRLLVHALAAAGDARGAHAVARVSLRGDLSGPITPEARPTWEVAYPNAFRGLIEKHCKENELDPDLLQALMREESALDPKALSWAGAIGLTQLMPSTAASVARRLKIKKVTTELLLEPDFNIRLGAAYLGGLHKRYGGTKPFMLAGYNAGETSVDKWRRERPDEELDVWVENIPIAETRGYVKRVLRSYNTYQLLYGRDAGAIAGRR